MTKDDIIKRVNALGLPEGSYVVFGSCPMALAGLREANDIDLLVTPELYVELQQQGWQKIQKGPRDTPVVFEVFEAHDNWDFSSYRPTLAQLLATATIVDGVPFASLAEVRAWKLASARPKDLADVDLIDKNLRKG